MKVLFYLIIISGLTHCSKGLPPVVSPETRTPPKPPEEQSEETTEELIDSLIKTKVFTFDQVKSKTPSEITKTIGIDEVVPHFTGFQNWKLHELTSDQLSRLLFKITFFGYLDDITSAQLKSLNPEIVRKELDPYIACLTPEQTKDLAPEQIAGIWAVEFTPEHIIKFNADQINALSGNHLTAEKVHVIPPEIIKTFHHRNIPFDRLTRAQVEAVTPEQIAYLDEYGYKGYGISKFTVEQIPWLTPEQISAHPIEIIKYIEPEQLAAMSDEQLRAISIEKSYEFKDRHLRALSFDQLLLFEENHHIDKIIGFAASGRAFFQKTNPRTYSQYEYYMQFIYPGDFKHVSYLQALGFSDNLLAVLSPERIKWMSHYARVLTTRLIQKDATEPDKWLITKEQFQAIPVEQIQDLSLEFLEAMTNEQVYWFTFEQLTHLSKDQLKRLFTAGFDEHIAMHVPKVFSIIHIAEQAEDGDEWLKGPMREVIMEHMEKECAQIYGCRETWMKFPNLPKGKKDNFFSPPPQPEDPIPTSRSYIFSCNGIKSISWYLKIKAQQ